MIALPTKQIRVQMPERAADSLSEGRQEFSKMHNVQISPSDVAGVSARKLLAESAA